MLEIRLETRNMFRSCDVGGEDLSNTPDDYENVPLYLTRHDSSYVMFVHPHHFLMVSLSE